MTDKPVCGFNEDWSGICALHAPCTRHTGKRWNCWCGAPGRRSCAYAGQFVCGMPLCPEHYCYLHTDKGVLQRNSLLLEQPIDKPVPHSDERPIVWPVGAQIPVKE